MRGIPVILAIVALVWAVSLPANTQQETVKLFSTTYNVECQSRAQTFKNQKTVVLQTEGAQKANLYFAEGPDPSHDRLFVVAPIGRDRDGPTGHQFYLLTGADANGNFGPDTASLTEFFGGNVGRSRAGRPVSVILLSDSNTGVGVDRNLLLTTITDNNAYRLYDLDSLDSFYLSDQVFSIAQREFSPDQADPKAPFGGLVSFAPGPNGSVVAFGKAVQGGGLEVGVWDPQRDQFFDVLTNLNKATATSRQPLRATTASGTGLFPHSVARIAANEYWLLYSAPEPGGDKDERESNRLVRLRLTFPADLSQGKPGSIRAEVLGMEELLGTPLHSTPGGVFGLTVGREVAPGLHRLYFADWEGNICVATPLH
jgi:hypothetical protein